MPTSQPEFAHLVEIFDRACRSSGFRNYMPERMAGHFVRQVLPSSLHEDTLDLDPFYQWVRQEYSVPDHVFARVFSRLKDDFSEYGIKLVLPESYNPGLDDSIRDWIKGELKEVVYEDLKEELREEVRTELKKELRPEVFRELREDLERMENADELIMDSLSQGGAIALSALAPETGRRDEEGPRSELAPALPPEMERELREKLVPLITEELRMQLEHELRPRVAGELKTSLRDQVESELRDQVEARLREEFTPRIHEQVAAEVRAMEHGRLSESLKEQFSESVREELRREIWDEVREEVKEDLREILKPVLEAEIRDELRAGPGAPHSISIGFLKPGEALEPESPEYYLTESVENCEGERGPSAASFRRGLRAEDQLKLIRRIREELTPTLRAKWTEELATMTRLEQERSSREQLKSRLFDSEYCLSRIQGFLFPEQPSLWEKVKPLIKPEKWRPIVLALEDDSRLDPDKLARARSIFREALKLKAEIDEEMTAPSRVHEAPRGRAQLQSIYNALSGADEILDFALSSITRLFEEAIPPSFQDLL